METAKPDLLSGKLEPEYRRLAPLAETFREEVSRQLDQLLQDADVTLGFPIESRVKGWDSIAEKIERKSLQLPSLSDLHDLVGFRIVLLFQRDVDVACRAVENHFDIIDSYDTQERLSEDQFGYSSKHFIVRLPRAWLTMPTFTQLGNLQAEIQVRTVAQHIWAAASHKLQYKQEQNVPLPVRRSISRVSALLETVDLELERVLKDRESYRATLDSSSVDAILEETDSVLDVDLLQRLLSAEFPQENRGENEDYGELLQELARAGIGTSRQLRDLISKYKDRALKSDKAMVKAKRAQLDRGEPIRGTSTDRIRRGVFFTHVGLVRQLLVADRASGAAAKRKRPQE